MRHSHEFPGGRVPLPWGGYKLRGHSGACVLGADVDLCVWHSGTLLVCLRNPHAPRTPACWPVASNHVNARPRGRAFMSAAVLRGPVLTSHSQILNPATIARQAEIYLYREFEPTGRRFDPRRASLHAGLSTGLLVCKFKCEEICARNNSRGEDYSTSRTGTWKQLACLLCFFACLNVDLFLMTKALFQI